MLETLKKRLYFQPEINYALSIIHYIYLCFAKISSSSFKAIFTKE